MKRSRSPIGIFDSGVGGLTVLKALRNRLPRADILYFGDTAHVPYGSKSKEAVTRYALAISRFLIGRGVKFLVVACNTASALALPTLRRTLGVAVVGVIRPGVRAAVQATRSGRLAVIATEATVASHAYRREIRRSNPRLRAIETACPLFVPLVEEGWWSHPVTGMVARRYLRPVCRYGTDTLILGCTHYPFLRPALQRVMGPKVRLIDSAEETAREVSSRLRLSGLLPDAGRGRTEFFASDGPERFLALARKFLGKPIEEVTIRRVD